MPDIQNIFDVLPTFRVERARRISVRELVDQNELRFSMYPRSEIEFLERHTAMVDLQLREQLEPQQERARFVTSVRFDDARDHVTSLIDLAARCLQHREGFSDAWSRAEKKP